ncbi:hypothetical protein [Gilvibacter sediminis]|uniref:hypothetical protein n=1 Tax=Gilvibacter sediminis TaxID=379071 RepID=UPI00234FD361|nr:hypothetical protein [Gilvibacter sediminis]MDC7997241.1 hypothetical protein [Gilvibacter sediminis]
MVETIALLKKSGIVFCDAKNILGKESNNESILRPVAVSAPFCFSSWKTSSHDQNKKAHHYREKLIHKDEDGIVFSLREKTSAGVVLQ